MYASHERSYSHHQGQFATLVNSSGHNYRVPVQVARVSGIATKGKNSRAEMLQRLTSCNLAHAYITDEDPQSVRTTALVELHHAPHVC